MATFSAELHKAAAGSHSQPINKEGALFRYGEREILGKMKRLLDDYIFDDTLRYEGHKLIYRDAEYDRRKKSAPHVRGTLLR